MNNNFYDIPENWYKEFNNTFNKTKVPDMDDDLPF